MRRTIGRRKRKREKEKGDLSFLLHLFIENTKKVRGEKNGE